MPPPTSFDGIKIRYTCPHCGHTREELADPQKNRLPFTFLGGHCTHCSNPLEIDWNVVDQARASFTPPCKKNAARREPDGTKLAIAANSVPREGT